MTRGRLSPLSLLLVVGALCLLAGSSSIKAAIAPCERVEPLNYFDGAWVTGVNQYGVEAYIDTHEGEICGPTSDSSAWVMEAGPRDIDGYAQVGYAHRGNGNFQIFIQYKAHNSDPPQSQYFDPPNYVTLHYKVGQNFNTGKLQMWQGDSTGDTQLGVTPFNPSNNWGSPWQGQLFGETFTATATCPAYSVCHL